jgi:hypothetical protein
MWKQAIAAVAVWAVIVACCFVFNETPTSASQDLREPTGAAPAQAPSPLELQPEPSGGQQMDALDRHARSRMICYTGRFGGTTLAAVALDLKTKP